MIAVAITGSGCGAEHTPTAGPSAEITLTSASSEDERRSALLRAASADEEYSRLVARLQQLGLSVDSGRTTYERDGQPAPDPETGEQIAQIDRIATPVVSPSKGELASLVYAVTSDGRTGIAFNPTSADADGSKLDELTAALGEAATADGAPEAAVAPEAGQRSSLAAVPCPYCSPWQCNYWSKRIWTWQCISRVAGGWARIPAIVAGYSCYPDHRDFAWYRDYEGRGIACPSHGTKTEGYRVCCPSLPCTGR